MLSKSYHNCDVPIANSNIIYIKPTHVMLHLKIDIAYKNGTSLYYYTVGACGTHPSRTHTVIQNSIDAKSCFTIRLKPIAPALTAKFTPFRRRKRTATPLLLPHQERKGTPSK